MAWAVGKADMATAGLSPAMPITWAGDLGGEPPQNDLCAGGFDLAVISVKRSDQLIAVLYEHR